MYYLYDWSWWDDMGWRVEPGWPGYYMLTVPRSGRTQVVLYIVNPFVYHPDNTWHHLPAWWTVAATGEPDDVAF